MTAEKPVLDEIWSDRGQIELIDLQSMPDGEYKWLLNYQDLVTKFVHLRPLKSNQIEEVADELLKIFLQSGAPKFLQVCIYCLFFWVWVLIIRVVHLQPDNLY